jgi:DNA-binding response OmpR family regulator
LSRTKILIVEDDPAILRGLSDALAFKGYAVLTAVSGGQGLQAALTGSPDLVLLDVLLPKMDGFTVLHEVRKARPQLPVIMLTARGTEEDRVRGLTEGADDYVVKPFSATELIARVEAVLRRSAERPRDVRTLAFADRTVNFDRLEVDLEDGSTLSISELEADIIRYLAVNRGRPIDRKEILQRVWQGDTREMETRTIDMHIRRLRKKLERDPSTPERIVTVRHRGYMLAGSES